MNIKGAAIIGMLNKDGHTSISIEISKILNSKLERMIPEVSFGFLLNTILNIFLTIKMIVHCTYSKAHLKISHRLGGL